MDESKEKVYHSRLETFYLVIGLCWGLFAVVSFDTTLIYSLLRLLLFGANIWLYWSLKNKGYVRITPQSVWVNPSGFFKKPLGTLELIDRIDYNEKKDSVRIYLNKGGRMFLKIGWLKEMQREEFRKDLSILMNNLKEYKATTTSTSEL